MRDAEVIGAVVGACAEHFNLTRGDLLSLEPRRGASARMVAMRICREVIGLPHATIGAAFGRGPRSVREACRSAMCAPVRRAAFAELAPRFGGNNSVQGSAVPQGDDRPFSPGLRPREEVEAAQGEA